MELKYDVINYRDNIVMEYEVQISEPCTVKQLIEFILEYSKKPEQLYKDKWYGDFCIMKSERHSLFDNLYVCGYEAGEIKAAVFWREDMDYEVFNEYANRKVEKVFGYGGYGNFDYDIMCEQTEEEKALFEKLYNLQEQRYKAKFAKEMEERENG